MPNFRQITPFLHVPNLHQALDLFVRVLKFEVLFRMSNYAYLERENVAVRIIEEPGREIATLGDSARMTVYIDVVDVDALHEDLLPELKTLPAGDFRSPEDQTWNQRELHVRLPDGHWLSFGQPVKSGRPAEGGSAEITSTSEPRLREPS